MKKLRAKLNVSDNWMITRSLLVSFLIIKINILRINNEIKSSMQLLFKLTKFDIEILYL